MKLVMSIVLFIIPVILTMLVEGMVGIDGAYVQLAVLIGICECAAAWVIPLIFRKIRGVQKRTV